MQAAAGGANYQSPMEQFHTVLLSRFPRSGDLYCAPPITNRSMGATWPRKLAYSVGRRKEIRTGGGGVLS